MIQENYSLTDNVKRKRYIGYINEDEEYIGFGEFYIMRYELK